MLCAQQTVENELQRSPDVAVGDRAFTPFPLEAPPVLQRSPDVAVGDRLSPTRRIHAVPRFNGGPTSPSGIETIHDQKMDRKSSLQRSPDVAVGDRRRNGSGPVGEPNGFNGAPTSPSGIGRCPAGER